MKRKQDVLLREREGSLEEVGGTFRDDGFFASGSSTATSSSAFGSVAFVHFFVCVSSNRSSREHTKETMKTIALAKR